MDGRNNKVANFTRNRNLWRVMIAHVLKGHCRKKKKKKKILREKDINYFLCTNSFSTPLTDKSANNIDDRLTTKLNWQVFRRTHCRIVQD